VRAAPVIFLLCSLLAARMPGGVPASVGPTEDAAQPWEFSFTGQLYFVPHEQDYFVPTFTADHEWLHLEARYQYEDLKTGSLWVGCNFSAGKELEFGATPMVGGVFGNTRGLAPGLKLSLGYHRFELSTESEYVFDLRDSAGSFFYNWSELRWSLADWFHVGLVGQRTRTYQSDREVQRGVLVGFSWKQADLTAYVLNPDESAPITIVSLGFHF
jgi:hypothetical protein